MIYSIPSDKLYTIQVEDEFKGKKIYDVEFLSFDEESAQKHLKERTKEIPSAKFQCECFLLEECGSCLGKYIIKQLELQQH